MNTTQQPENMPDSNPLDYSHPPIWQELVIDLFFRPRRFFTNLSVLLQTRYVVAVTLVFGFSQAIDKIDQELLKISMNTESSRSEIILKFTDSWINYWGFVVVYGGIAALFLWWIGGWWYRKRLEWSNAIDPDHRLARVIYIYSSFVVAAPVVLTSLIYTVVYPNYIEAFNSDELWSILILLFYYWSLITSYIGVRTTFNVSKWKARIWFIILPGLFYFVVLIGFAILFYFLDQ